MDAEPEPRPAATVLLLRDHPLRVLLVRRPSRGAFPSVLAFPGGSVDPGDGDPGDGTDAAARVAAARETAEETGIALSPDTLVPWARWITPPGEPRRFDTFFFAARSPAGAEAMVDGVELLEAFWAEPAAALRRRTSGEWPIIAPTAFNLLRLAQTASVDAALDDARARTVVPIRPEPVIGAEGAVRIRIPPDAGYPLTELGLR